MKDLELLNLMIKDGDVWISSVQIAEISGKLHHNVLRDIRETLKKNFQCYPNLSRIPRKFKVT